MSRFNPLFQYIGHAGLVLALGLVATSASAQAWEVVDHDAINAIKEGFKKQADMEQRQLDQLTFQLAGLSLTTKLPDQDLKTLDDSARAKLVDKSCGSGASDSIGNIKSGLGALLSTSVDQSQLKNQPVSQSQQQICAGIVATEIDKYNVTVKMLDRAHDYKSTLDILTNSLNSVERAADANLLSSHAQVYSSALDTEIANWRMQMEAYDAMTRTLREQQAMLARIALNGTGSSDGNTGGSLLQTALTAVLLNLQ
jgi:hypothetical protein